MQEFTPYINRRKIVSKNYTLSANSGDEYNDWAKTQLIDVSRNNMRKTESFSLPDAGGIAWSRGFNSLNKLSNGIYKPQDD